MTSSASPFEGLPVRGPRDFSLVLGGPLYQVAAEERLVGSGDIQSLADLGNSFETIRAMRMIPFTKEAVFQLSAATLAPVVPLTLTMMSLEDLLKRLFGILL